MQCGMDAGEMEKGQIYAPGLVHHYEMLNVRLPQPMI